VFYSFTLSPIPYMKKNKKGCDLKSCMLCQLCIPEWLPAIDSNRQCLHIKKGETLFAEGEKVTGMYFIYSGSMKVHKKWDSEKELIVRIAKKGDIVGHRGLGKDIYYPVSGTALEATDVCFVPLEFFIASVKVNHEFLFQLMLFFAGELKESEKNMRNLAHMPVKGRVAMALLNLQSKFGVNNKGLINITISRQDLASFAGTTYETVFKIINELKREGLLNIDGKDIGIIDTKKLVSMTNQ
jgi:CRP-like cAMP-binding protein